MNINELKELVKHCVYIEKGITCMSDTYYNDMIQTIENLQSKIDKAIEYIEKDTRWFDSEYASIYGELCDCEGYNANRLEVMVNPSNLLKILKDNNLESEIYEIKALKESNKELYDVQFKLYQIIDKNANNLELTDEECLFLDYYNNKVNALYNLIDKQGENDDGKTTDI